LRTLADFENLQKISTREKAQAKDFALTSFAKDLVSSIDILHLALKSIAVEKLADSADLKNLHEGVSLTKREIEKTLARHGVKAFDPTGEMFDPNRHEALYQAPVPGKEPGSVLECQEIGCKFLFAPSFLIEGMVLTDRESCMFRHYQGSITSSCQGWSSSRSRIDFRQRTELEGDMIGRRELSGRWERGSRVE